MSAPAFRPDVVLAALREHDVRFVLIGGFAAIVHGSPTLTLDVDVVPEPGTDNMARLSAALTDLGARIRVEGIDEGLSFSHGATSLQQMNVLNLVTIGGSLDITLTPAGVADFTSWDAGATDAVVLDVPVRLAALADVIASKEAADRDKDRAVLPMLRELARRLAQQESQRDG